MSNAGGSYEKAYASCYHAFVAIVFDAVGGAGRNGLANLQAWHCQIGYS